MTVPQDEHKLDLFTQLGRLNMTQHKQLSRRRFLALGCGAFYSAILSGGCAARAGTSVLASSCPYGEVADPYPGRCHRYTDQNGSGFCDYSEAQDSASPTSTPSVEAKAQTDDTADQSVPSRSAARCPKGLVNDPYPGRCHHYTDRDGSGYCDLSEAA